MESGQIGKGKLIRPNGKKKEKVFDQINLFRTLRQTDLEFKTYHF